MSASPFCTLKVSRRSAIAAHNVVKCELRCTARAATLTAIGVEVDQRRRLGVVDLEALLDHGFLVVGAMLQRGIVIACLAHALVREKRRHGEPTWRGDVRELAASGTRQQRYLPPSISATLNCRPHVSHSRRPASFATRAHSGSSKSTTTSNWCSCTRRRRGSDRPQAARRGAAAGTPPSQSPPLAASCAGSRRGCSRRRSRAP